MIGLPLDPTDPRERRRRHGFYAIAVGVLVTIIVLTTTNLVGYLRIVAAPVDKDICPLYDPIAPASFHKDNATVLDILYDKKYRKQSVKKLQGAVKIDTTIVDNQPDVDEAPEIWAKFQKIHDYLEEAFPLVYANLEVQKVNTYGLVFYWKGSEDLKPLMLTGHLDTVPIQKDSIGDWTYPPYDAHYDGEFLYGRGSVDCKNVVIAILESLELLLHKGFKPQRPILAAFGFDEEASGRHGASSIATYLEERFGHNSVYAIIDEGPGLLLDGLTDTIVAPPAVAEKGYMDIEVQVRTKGGHSSTPPDHTSIGILSELNYVIEQDPYEPVFTKKSPLLDYVQCMAVHDPKKKLGKLAKKAILQAGYNKVANSKVVKSLLQNKVISSLIRTTQAIDLISGGEKANALPESASAVVNHRIAIESNTSELKHHFTSRVIKVAKNHNLEVVAFGETVYSPKDSKGVIRVDAFGTPLEIAPLTPTSGSVYEYFAGVVRHVFEELVFPDYPYPIVTAPIIMPGNTDTKHYWNLTKHIYRSSPYFFNVLVDGGIHSVDEKILFDAHLQLHAFFYEYIQAVDTSKAG
ncbi:putative carboxypeptidase [Suhomyces tanzawaensis NRRL Y-17324]|uniref:Putative carboxypeptidase n=1 Tax=Suhomyces tanzawaensis NRRL Y-17324 TaxID=984487 RepID=A0A1E4SFU1_9ASCO|nr:putative carboxypeptidase [Suhomyces tanzawaensis NRRL Y-17324]ODV78389.1 putative carboxypeptidase [Suhomyces tanzawaensis NRRL Y-17324]